MRLPFPLLLGFALSCGASAALGAERKNCLSAEEGRAAHAAQKTVPLARAMRVVKARIGGEVVRARLCRQERGLVYVLTVLARDGKVVEARVDAAGGHWLDGS